jgi:RNA polymerase sigma factor (sigma-70 family)
MNRNEHAGVYIVDDDDDLRRSLQWMLTEAGFDVQAYNSADQFLEDYDPSMGGCLLLDVRMPGMSGVDLQSRLVEKQSSIPVIVMSAYGDVSLAVEAMRSGAIDFIEKPFKRAKLLERVEQALKQGESARQRASQLEEIQQRVARLTPRERQVMQRVVIGHSTKQIAYEWNVSVRTIEVHRSRIMRKMQADSIAELVLMAAQSGIATQAAA